MKTFWKILLYVIGFPLMAVCVYLESRPILEAGSTYGIYVYGGILIAAAMALIYIIVGLVTWGVSRKTKSRKCLHSCTAALVITSVLLTTGVWLAVDKVMPDILSDATSGTISYEDIREDYVEAAEYHELLLTKFIDMNIANGNLDKTKEATYREEGWANQEVNDLIKTNFKSIDTDGYNSFVGPWLDLANDGRMTIPTIVHLIINDRQESDETGKDEDAVIFIYKGEGREKAGETKSPIKWTILDMQEGSLDFSFDVGGIVSGLGDESMSELIMSMLVGNIDKNADDANIMLSTVQQMVDSIVGGVNNAIADEALAGSAIYLDISLTNEDGIGEGVVSISITPASESRGVWDYMHMAWLNSNDLLFMVISLFPARNIMLFFGGIIIVLSIIIGAIRERQYASHLKSKTPIQNADNAFVPQQEQAQAVAAIDRPYSKEYDTPYMNACYRSFNNYQTKGFLNLPNTIDTDKYGR